MPGTCVFSDVRCSGSLPAFVRRPSHLTVDDTHARGLTMFDLLLETIDVRFDAEAGLLVQCTAYERARDRWRRGFRKVSDCPPLCLCDRLPGTYSTVTRVPPQFPCTPKYPWCPHTPRDSLLSGARAALVHAVYSSAAHIEADHEEAAAQPQYQGARGIGGAASHPPYPLSVPAGLSHSPSLARSLTP